MSKGAQPVKQEDDEETPPSTPGVQQPVVPEPIRRIAENYAKLWGVSYDEALNRVLKMMEKNILPELSLIGNGEGELTSKVKDVASALLTWNQAKMLMSSNDTAQSIMQQLVQLLEARDSKYEERFKGIETALTELKNIITGVSEQKVVNLIKDEVSQQLKPIRDVLEQLKPIAQNETTKQIQELVKPIIDKLSELEDRLSTLEKQPSMQSSGSIVEQIIQLKNTTEELKKAMQQLGYRVVSDTITPDDVEKMITQYLESLSPEQLAALAQKKGLKVVGKPMTPDEVEKIVEEVRRRAYEEALSEKRTEQAVEIIREGLRYVFDLFKPAVQQQLTKPPTPVTPPQPVTPPINQVTQTVQNVAQKVAETIKEGGGS